MSEPQRLGEFLPEVMQNIRKRCEQNPDNKAFSPTVRRHTTGVISATNDYFTSHKPSRQKQHQSKKQEQMRLL